MALDLSTILTTVLTLTTIITIIRNLVTKTKTKTKTKTPSPQSYPIIGNLIGFLVNHRRFHDWVSDMLSDTPSLTLQVNGFLNLSTGICTADPRNIQHMLSSNFQNYVKGQRFHDFLSELLGHGIFNVDGHLWTVQRKIASHEFSTNSLNHFTAKTVSRQVSEKLIPALSTLSEDETKAVDFQGLLQKFGFDNVCKFAFGFDSGSEFAEAFDVAVSVCSSRAMSPLPIAWKAKRLFNVGSEKRLKEAIEIIDSLVTKIIEAREGPMLRPEREDHGQDLLSRFMSSISDKDFPDQERRRKFLKDIVTSFILAGRDSTSTALTWFFWLLSAHPRCVDSIRRELSKASGFRYDDLKRLNYLHAAISESLRLFPPVPINSRLAVSEDVLPDGTRVGKGWFANYSAYAMARMERLWGSDCREFRPERWLDEDGVFKPRNQFDFPVFHSGPRICLGKEMAYVQMKLVAATVLSEFDIVALDGGGCAENMANPPYVLSLFLKMKGGFLVNVKRRR